MVRINGIEPPRRSDSEGVNRGEYARTNAWYSRTTHSASGGNRGAPAPRAAGARSFALWRGLLGGRPRGAWIVGRIDVGDDEGPHPMHLNRGPCLGPRVVVHLGGEQRIPARRKGLHALRVERIAHTQGKRAGYHRHILV